MIQLPSKAQVAKLIYPEIFSGFDEVKAQLELEQAYRQKLQSQCTELVNQVNVLKNVPVKVQPPAVVDFYDAKYLCDNQDYQQKRKWQGKPISIELNQMICPNQFEVQKVRKSLKLSSIASFYSKVQTAANWASKNNTWTDDKSIDASGDYYLYPEEIIVSGKGDCEDHAFLMASLVDGVAVCYGFYDDGKQRFGHAFNIFNTENKYYILDTVGDTPEIKTFPDKNFDVYFIITKDKTYQLKPGVSFGQIAQW